MTNQMNEVHGRIAARQRQKVRGGRHFMSEARKAKSDQQADWPYGSLSKCGQCLGEIYWAGKYWDHVGQKLRHPATPAIGPSGNFMVYPPNVQTYEAVSPSVTDQQLSQMFDAATALKLSALHERRSDGGKVHSRVQVTCRADEWQKVLEAGR